MTIGIERQPSQVNAGKVFCNDCNKHLSVIHKGYGDESMPLASDDMDMLEDMAGLHDKRFPLHNIRIILFQRESSSDLTQYYETMDEPEIKFWESRNLNE